MDAFPCCFRTVGILFRSNSPDKSASAPRVSPKLISTDRRLPVTSLSMRILAIDTALANCAAAVWDSGEGDARASILTEEIGRGHAERLMGMIGEVMAEASCAFTGLDRIAVTTGPGSFTGMRVGLSVARGFGLVLSKPVIGITTLAAIAAPHLKDFPETPLFVALEGKGEEIYCQLFNPGEDKHGDAEVRRLSELKAFLPEQVRFAGSAARAACRAAGYGDDRILSETAYPNVLDVAHLGMTADPKSAHPSPLYLRPPDAAPQTKGKIARL